MLADGQDPTALEARLAYHLHRLSITGEPLREALKGKAYLATALSQGRATIDQDFIDGLAATLNINADDMTRPLLQEETREWSFYRTSAANREAVWENTSAVIRNNNLSLRTVSEITGINPGDLANAMSGKRPRVLEWHHAEAIASISSPPFDPASLLPEAPSR